MPEIDIDEFDGRLNGQECSQLIREVVAHLRRTAERAGDVVWRAHSTPGGGWGITAKRERTVFCRLDPKPSVLHVCVSVLGASDDELEPAGKVHVRKGARSWVDIRDMRGAQVLEPLIARAYAVAVTSRGEPGAGVPGRPGPRRSALTQPSRPNTRPRPLPHDGPVSTSHVGQERPLVSVRGDLTARGFIHAGAIRPLDSGRVCRAELKPLGLQGRIVYGLVVGDELKKCGDTGRKKATLLSRMTSCARTINQVIRGDIVGPFTERFKNLAPLAIEANQEIEVWAREATNAACKDLQRELNGTYDTIRTGWADRLE